MKIKALFYVGLILSGIIVIYANFGHSRKSENPGEIKKYEDIAKRLLHYPKFVRKDFAFKTKTFDPEILGSGAETGRSAQIKYPKLHSILIKDESLAFEIEFLRKMSEGRKRSVLVKPANADSLKEDEKMFDHVFFIRGNSKRKSDMDSVFVIGAAVCARDIKVLDCKTDRSKVHVKYEEYSHPVKPFSHLAGMDEKACESESQILRPGARKTGELTVEKS